MAGRQFLKWRLHPDPGHFLLTALSAAAAVGLLTAVFGVLVIWLAMMPAFVWCVQAERQRHNPLHVCLATVLVLAAIVLFLCTVYPGGARPGQAALRAEADLAAAQARVQAEVLGAHLDRHFAGKSALALFRPDDPFIELRLETLRRHAGKVRLQGPVRAGRLNEEMEYFLEPEDIAAELGHFKPDAVLAFCGLPAAVVAGLAERAAATPDHARDQVFFVVDHVEPVPQALVRAGALVIVARHPAYRPPPPGTPAKLPGEADAAFRQRYIWVDAETLPAVLEEFRPYFLLP
jgi:hypothetical protein